MAKMRVHELAKELEIESKNIVEFLAGTEYEVKSANSGVEDAAQDMVRSKFAKKTADAPKAEAAKTEGEAKERPKKKASIAAVFNPQYSKQPQRRPGGPNGNGQQRKLGARPDGERPARPENRGPKRDGAPKQEQHTIIKPRPVGERAMRPISERTQQNDDLVMTSTAQTQKEATPVERPQSDRPNRGDRPQGDRPNRGDRPQGDRPNRGERPQGDRPNRGDRPQGDRPNRGDRPQNDRPGKDNFRGNDRNDRNSGKGRFDREKDKYNQESAAA